MSATARPGDRRRAGRLDRDGHAVSASSRSSRRRRPRAGRPARLAAALATTALAGCGGGSSAEDVLRETAAGVKEIERATLEMRLVLGPRDGARDGRVGFALDGPIDLRSDGELPVARLRYTQIAGPSEGGATFISTGRAAFVDLDGTAYRLPRDQTGALRESASAVRKGVELPVGRWFKDARVSDGGTIDGQPTDHVSAELDAAAALRDIFAAARQAGGQVPNLDDAGTEELRESVDDATVDLWSGREDHVLRRLRIRVSFEIQPPPALRDRLGKLAGGRFAFDLVLRDVGEPVRVRAPAGTQPASALG